ncbi:response regulator [Giesbergeria anulus]|uniref:Two-component system, OmpR family, KDP operon response regulator KdpE n=1 Tax=Giesbergeria anulus TaxID=180197 RepID=A0A1H9PBT3_9BURK|nr:response regulator [Giesbergeria anulus]SER45365.1 two-component system, OmpR family, KDP operon response regulator KdpE [Giesbergeria anulus]
MNLITTHVLIIEDEVEIRRFLRLTLQAEGYTVHEASTLARGLIEAATRCPDLLVVDLGLPDGDGIDLIKELRQWSAAPVIILSARSHEDEKIRALDFGADDYLVKPFSTGELMARVRAQLRRGQKNAIDGSSMIRFGNITIDLARRIVSCYEKPLHLTPIEYKLLTHLASQPDRVVTHGQLLKSVWGPGHTEDTHYVRVHMGNLRKKIEINPSMPQHLLTETGVGYRFVP